MGVEVAREPAEEGAGGEQHDLGPARVDAHGEGRRLAVAHRHEAPPRAGAEQTHDRQQRQGHDDQHEVVERDRGVKRQPS